MSARIFHQPCDKKMQGLQTQLAEHLAALPAHSDTTWYWAVSAQPLGISPGVEADALIERVFDYLKNSFGITDHQGGGGTYKNLPVKAMIVWSVTSDWLTTKLSLVHCNDGVFAFVSGTFAGPDQALLKPWIDALEFALANAGQDPVHTWQAVLGMEYTNGVRDILIKPEIQIGGITLRKAEVAFEEKIPRASSLQAYRLVRWQPVLVAGSNKVHSWNAAQFEAQEQLHLVCAILSLHTNCVWSVRESVLPVTYGTLALPQSTERLKQVPIETLTTSTISVDESKVAQLWEACQSASGSAAIARAYYEALRLVEHPSFALVAFVGVIEEVGSKLFQAPPQENCGSCKRPIGNSAAARFRKALALVLPADHVKDVSERLYKWRSGTAHAGRTHSTEKSFGHPQMSESMLAADAAMLFSAQGPSHAQEIARDLVLHLLLPPPVLTVEVQEAPKLGDVDKQGL
ncbi:MAG: hypothetical protein JWP93_2339 [Polaromonas sp.]|nr:hypothetical protein [Polaromonas sp.]